MKFGFELEAFVAKTVDGDRSFVLVPNGIPYDECGWLAEVRSEPHHNILKAAYLLQAEQKTVENLATNAGVTLEYLPLAEIPRDLKVQAARKHGKGLLRYRNIYGFETHRNPTKFQTASLHVSFTNEQVFGYNEFVKGVSVYKKYNYAGFVDHAKLIVGLDDAFEDEIKAAKRNPGFYEVKPDGRIEYRSLPNNVSLDKVVEVLTRLT